MSTPVRKSPAEGCSRGPWQLALATAFRYVLEYADAMRSQLGMGLANPAASAALAGAIASLGTYLAIWIGRYDRNAGGSGIPHMKAVLEGHASMPWLRLIAVKFLGAVASIGSGLAMGREGPTVQMGGGCRGLRVRLG